MSEVMNVGVMNVGQSYQRVMIFKWLKRLKTKRKDS